MGALHDAYLSAADPKVGEMRELNVIAAVVGGGASLFSRRLRIVRTLIRAFIISVLNSSPSPRQIELFWQKVALVAAILLTVRLDSTPRRLG